MFLVAAAGLALGLLPPVPAFTTAASLAALFFIALTSALLVLDLDRPERFWTILTRPQWRSWLTRGTFVLLGFASLLVIVLAAHLVGDERLAAALRWPGVLLAALAAVYTAFLFAQAEGRDLWQSPLLPAHLLVQAVMAGCAGFLLLGPFLDLPAEAVRVLTGAFGLALAANLLLTAGGEFAVPHASTVASAAARMITRGRYAPHYWGSVVGGLLLPLGIVLLAGSSPPALAAAAALSILGLLGYEWAYVFAPQRIPNN
jgi:formate-dependent nitrite reductase membrane component NrfD